MKLSATCLLSGAVLLAWPKVLWAVEDDYEFMPADAWAGRAETGEDDATTALAEGFEGQTAEVTKNVTIEPVDGAGGFDNVAPRLAVEEGPGGLEWDPSPTYRTRYKGSTDYTVGSSHLQGNNWFPKLPYIQYDSISDKYVVRLDANTFRVYDRIVGTNPAQYTGRYGNKNSKVVNNQYGVPSLYDNRGKTYAFSGQNANCTQITGLGGSYVTIDYGVPNQITVTQKTSAGSSVRQFIYDATSNRIHTISTKEWNGTAWVLYRTVYFKYFEEVTGAVEGSTGDLIGVEDEKLLSPSSTWFKRRWVYKYYTGTYNSGTNPGYPYQVRSVLGPQSVRDFEKANPTTDIYTQTTSQLASYVDRTYTYYSDKRINNLDLKSGCGCGGGEGLYAYVWDVNGSTPSDFNTWNYRATITLPSVNGSSRIIDYNKYGQTLNSIAQEVAGNSSSRRWIRSWTRDTTARLTDSYSVKACTSYTDSTHIVTTNNTAGQHFTYAYDGNSALTVVKLRDPSNGNLNYQLKKAFSLITSGDRRSFVNTSNTVYPTETTTDTGGISTSYSYTYQTSDALAIKLRTTTLPAVATGENGSGSSIALKDYFETDGTNTWTKDGDGYVHYTAFDGNRRTATKKVVDLNTSSLPSGVPSPPDPTFNTSAGLNLVTDITYDMLRRMTKQVLPAFTDDTNTSVNITKQWWYTKLSGGEFVVVAYPHVDTAFYESALTLTVYDFEDHVLTAALGDLSSGYRDTILSDDFDPAQSTLDAGFHGTIVRRTEYAYDGSKVTTETVWTVANDTNATKYTTTSTYDAEGRRVTTTNAVGTITRSSYDVLDRVKSRKLGTIDGGPSNNMTLVEELFYDDEEDTSTNVGDGNLTRRKLYTGAAGARITDSAYDYRQRLTQVDEPLSVRETRSYTNRNQVSVIQRSDVSSGSTLMSKDESFYDAWGQVYETRTHGVSGGTDSGYSNVRFWRNGRGQVVKELTQGKVFKKTQHDGAGRVTNNSMTYDTAETAYSDASNLTGDTVIRETVYKLDNLGGQILVRNYERNHNGTGTGDLTVGTSGNSRPQYVATWFDKVHRPTYSVNYGTNGGTDLTDRPAGAPPSSSSSTSLVTKSTFTIKGEAWQITDPLGIITQMYYDDPGRQTKKVDHYVDGTPGPGSDEDRTTEYTYNGIHAILRITAKSTVDQVTENVYGTTVGAFPASYIASNDLLKQINYPDPTTGAPSSSSVDQEFFAYNILGETIWREDQQGTDHILDYDDRGRLAHDRITAVGTGLDTSLRRTSRTYDALDRPLKVTTYNNPTVGLGTVLNEKQSVYGKYNMVETDYQEWAGAVSTATSRKVQYAFSYPTDGTTGLRRTSTTYTDTPATVIDDVYNSGTDDTISRLSGKKKSGTWLYQEAYLGLGRLVHRDYGTTGIEWTLLGTDTDNQDNYLGLDRFGRIDDLTVKSGTQTYNRYQYSYNYNSQVSLRKDLVANVAGSYEFDELFTYDYLGRLTDHQRGHWAGFTMSPLRLHECWTYDRSGNSLYYYSGTSATCGSTSSGTFNGSNEWASWSGGTITYNNRGAMTQKANNNWSYQPWYLKYQVKFVDILESTYKYNGDKQKVARNDASYPNTYYYLTTGGRVVDEVDQGSGSLLKDYVWGTQYIDDLVLKNAASPEFSVLDANFNVVTRISASGSVAARYIYKAYGGPTELSPDWSTIQTISDEYHLFTGRLYHSDHSQYDFRLRDQDPAQICFTKRDQRIWGDPVGFGNGYSYVGADPLNRTDPLGKQAGPVNPYQLPQVAGGSELVQGRESEAAEIEKAQREGQRGPGPLTNSDVFIGDPDQISSGEMPPTASGLPPSNPKALGRTLLYVRYLGVNSTIRCKRFMGLYYGDGVNQYTALLQSWVWLRGTWNVLPQYRGISLYTVLAHERAHQRIIEQAMDSLGRANGGGGGRLPSPGNFPGMGLWSFYGPGHGGQYWTAQGCVNDVTQQLNYEGLTVWQNLQDWLTAATDALDGTAKYPSIDDLYKRDWVYEPQDR